MHCDSLPSKASLDSLGDGRPGMISMLPLRAPHRSTVEAARSSTCDGREEPITRSAALARQQLPRTAGLDARTVQQGKWDEQRCTAGAQDATSLEYGAHKHHKHLQPSAHLLKSANSGATAHAARHGYTTQSSTNFIKCDPDFWKQVG